MIKFISQSKQDQ